MAQTDKPPESFDDLIAAARTGETDALDRVFARFFPHVERQVHRALATDLRTGRPWLVTRFSTGDIVQEVFRSVLADPSRFQGGTEREFAGYLAAVVRNRLLDVLRYHEAEQRDGRRTLARTEDDEVSPHDGPATDALSEDQRIAYEEALAMFEPREQALLRGRIEQSREFKELTADLGYSSVSAAQRTFYRAQARLSIRLRQRGFDER
jgi:RNA polymerase sigma factor (sigma-70 family)